MATRDHTHKSSVVHNGNTMFPFFEFLYTVQCTLNNSIPFCHAGVGHSFTGFPPHPILGFFPFPIEDGEAETRTPPPPTCFLGALAATAIRNKNYLKYFK